MAEKSATKNPPNSITPKVVQNLLLEKENGGENEKPNLKRKGIFPANENGKRVKLNVEVQPINSDDNAGPSNSAEFEQFSHGSETKEDEGSTSENLLDNEEDCVEVLMAFTVEGSENISIDLEPQGDLNTDKDLEIESWPWLFDTEKTDASVTLVPILDGNSKVEAITKEADKLIELEIQEANLPRALIDEPPESAEEPPITIIEEEPAEDLNVFENSLKTNKVLAVLKQDTEFYGTVIVTLLSGKVTINGFKARKNEPLTVFSPKGFNWVTISPKLSKKLPQVNAIWEPLEEAFTRAQVENILTKYDGLCDAIVLLQRNSGAQKIVNTFSKQMSENVFPLVNVTNRPNYASEYLLNCLVKRADKAKALQIPRVWTKLRLKQKSRFIITGGKGVGKSTLLRYLLNRTLESYARVLLIDLDIGQPELFLPQTVSCTVMDTPLLGPGFFLNKQPNLAFVVGHVDVVMCAEPYVRAIRKLLHHCWESPSLKGIPWLINTMGYNKGLGTELMALIVDCVEPTDLVQIYSTKAINNFDEPLDRQFLSSVVPMMYVSDEFKRRGFLPKYALHHLMSAVPQMDNRSFKRWSMSARDVRYSNLLTRLSATLHGNANYITDCRPVHVELDALQIVHITSAEYSRKQLIAGMESNMVYLCKRSSSDEPVECVGIGVVRAINYKTEKVYLVPAMPFEQLTKVNCLVIGGGMCLPQGFFKDQGASVANNVPFVFVIDDSNSSKSVQQIYHRAPGFLGNPENKTN